LPSAPPATFLLSATPIAAMDVRWPLMAVNGSDTHLLEPIAQLVYRGSSTSDVGITDDDSQGFVFDDSNLFSYDRFSGIDRQETGLRANLGAHYLGNFGNGSWLDLVAGESFQLAGANAFDALDPTLTGTDSGLDSTASYLVAGARAGFTNGITVGTKVQVDPSAPRVTRAGLGVTWSPGNRFSVGATYVYVAADPTLGLPSPQHEIAGSVSLPVDDYWTVNGGLTYNIAATNWIKANAALTYDDGYFSAGVFGDFAPTDYTVGIHLKLKGPDGSLAF
ncbi:MAG TPA: LPS assembly protein LptD, partial [Devosia sp.]|nr:LPS assembly protein LptD [Devosia sp.]